jgi:hypothetical protein
MAVPLFRFRPWKTNLYPHTLISIVHYLPHSMIIPNTAPPDPYPHTQTHTHILRPIPTSPVPYTQMHTQTHPRILRPIPTSPVPTQMHTQTHTRILRPIPTYSDPYPLHIPLHHPRSPPDTDSGTPSCHPLLTSPPGSPQGVWSLTAAWRRSHRCSHPGPADAYSAVEGWNAERDRRARHHRCHGRQTQSYSIAQTQQCSTPLV